MADISKVEHLSYVYNPGLPTAVTALDDVSFTVEEGDFVGIIGATGSGKSTLITHMNGLNKPTSGKIYIDGRDLWADPVSYTHLDVYKRQAPSTATNSPRFTCTDTPSSA